MELKGFVRKFGKGDSFDPLKDSKLNGDPVFPDSISFEPPVCDLCSSSMTFLLQLSPSQGHNNRNRLLFVYYCINDVNRDQGWKVYRYSTEKKSGDAGTTFGGSASGTTEPVFGDMNVVSSWIDGLNISTPTTADFNDGSLRVILENDVVYDDYDVHSIVLLEKYKNKTRDEIDEEDLVDFQAIKYSENHLEEDADDDDNDTGDDDDSERDEEVEAINSFHQYISARPNVSLRINKGGKPISFLTNVNYASTCSRCGSQTTFELQLLPNLIKYLPKPASNNSEKSNKLDDINMRLGGVVFYTCDTDCLTSELVQEHSHVLLYQ